MIDDLFHVRHLDSAHVVSLALPHALDSQVFDRLNDQLLGVFTATPEANWILDLSQVAYMGSSALGLLVNIRQRVKQAGGHLVLCGLSPQLLQIFRTCCMERLFKITRSCEEAVRISGR